MGRALLQALREQADLELSGALASRRSSAADGIAAPGVKLTADHAVALAGADVAIDFTVPEAVSANVAACLQRRVPMVLGTTGLDEATVAAIRAASRSIAILQSPNMSIGVNVLLGLVESAARALGPDYDVEIVDLHHRHKRDAPSGTALKLGEAVATARGQQFDAVAVRERVSRNQPRGPGEIGFAAVRAGDHVGEHTVLFSGSGESVTVAHRATDRMTFARGALRAARWLVGRPAGLYSMRDALSTK